MDTGIARGPRRARHVAANSSVASADGGQTATTPNLQPPAAPHAARRRLVVTPTGTGSHQNVTPNEAEAEAGAEAPASPASPPHPFRLHRTNRLARLSMPELSDDSGSEPDVSILGNRGAQADAAQRTAYNLNSENSENIQEGHLGAEDTSVEDEEDFDDDDDEEDHYDPHAEDDEELEGQEQPEDEQPEFGEPLADPAAQGLKEISNLGRFTVSTHKQGNGVDELRSDDLNQYWQSDGPQPHKLTVYFIKRVGIRDLRFYVNFAEDESYTPTSITFKSGTSENNLIQFAHLTLDSPVGWQQVPLEGAGGGSDGNTLVSYVLQMQILENHQNGKDTHLRGIKIYAFDMDSTQAAGRVTNPVDEMVEIMTPVPVTGEGGAATAVEPQPEADQGNVRLSGLMRRLAEARVDSGEAGFTVPDFMRDPELR